MFTRLLQRLLRRQGMGRPSELWSLYLALPLELSLQDSGLHLHLSAFLPHGSVHFDTQVKAFCMCPTPSESSSLPKASSLASCAPEK